MPATSRSQFRFMKNVANKAIKVPGLSPGTAAEYTTANTGPLSYGKLREKMRKASKPKGMP